MPFIFSTARVFILSKVAPSGRLNISPNEGRRSKRLGIVPAIPVFFPQSPHIPNNIFPTKPVASPNNSPIVPTTVLAALYIASQPGILLSKSGIIPIMPLGFHEPHKPLTTSTTASLAAPNKLPKPFTPSVIALPISPQVGRYPGSVSVKKVSNPPNTPETVSVITPPTVPKTLQSIFPIQPNRKSETLPASLFRLSINPRALDFISGRMLPPASSSPFAAHSALPLLFSVAVYLAIASLVLPVSLIKFSPNSLAAESIEIILAIKASPIKVFPVIISPSPCIIVLGGIAACLSFSAASAASLSFPACR